MLSRHYREIRVAAHTGNYSANGRCRKSQSQRENFYPKFQRDKRFEMSIAVKGNT